MGQYLKIHFCIHDSSEFLNLFPSLCNLYYVTVMSITPGPDNLMLATSGVNFGMRRTLPVVMGVLFGCAIQTAIAGLMLDVLLQWMSAVRLPLALLGCTYLLWLSWKIFRSGAPEMQGKARPMTMLGGILFQAVNPKAWLIAINVALMYNSNNGILTVALGFMALNLPCIIVWAVMGIGWGVIYSYPGNCGRLIPVWHCSWSTPRCGRRGKWPGSKKG